MTDANDTTYPNPEPLIESARGLTKREYFAAMAMQGLLAAGEIHDKRAIAENAVRNADYLIEALNK